MKKMRRPALLCVSVVILSTGVTAQCPAPPENAEYSSGSQTGGDCVYTCPDATSFCECPLPFNPDSVEYVSGTLTDDNCVYKCKDGYISNEVPDFNGDCCQEPMYSQRVDYISGTALAASCNYGCTYGWEGPDGQCPSHYKCWCSTPVNIDCVQSAWSEWTSCECPEAEQTRTRSIEIQPANDGASCGPDQESQTCACCGDGIQNGGETGIDCGGSCAACCVPPAFASTVEVTGNQDDGCVYSCKDGYENPYPDSPVISSTECVEPCADPAHTNIIFKGREYNNGDWFCRYSCSEAYAEYYGSDPAYVCKTKCDDPTYDSVLLKAGGNKDDNTCEYECGSNPSDGELHWRGEGPIGFDDQCYPPCAPSATTTVELWSKADGSCEYFCVMGWEFDGLVAFDTDCKESCDPPTSATVQVTGNKDDSNCVYSCVADHEFFPESEGEKIGFNSICKRPCPDAPHSTVNYKSGNLDDNDCAYECAEGYEWRGGGGEQARDLRHDDECVEPCQEATSATVKMTPLQDGSCHYECAEGHTSDGTVIASTVCTKPCQAPMYETVEVTGNQSDGCVYSCKDGYENPTDQPVYGGLDCVLPCPDPVDASVVFSERLADGRCWYKCAEGKVGFAGEDHTYVCKTKCPDPASTTVKLKGGNVEDETCEYECLDASDAVSLGLEADAPYGWMWTGEGYLKQDSVCIVKPEFICVEDPVNPNPDDSVSYKEATSMYDCAYVAYGIWVIKCDTPTSDTVEVTGNKTMNSCAYTCKTGYEFDGSVVVDTVCCPTPTTDNVLVAWDQSPGCVYTCKDGYVTEDMAVSQDTVCVAEPCDAPTSADSKTLAIGNKVEGCTYECMEGYKHDEAVDVDTVCKEECVIEPPASDTVEVTGNGTDDTCAYSCKTGFEFDGSVGVGTVCVESCDAPASETVEVAGNKTEGSCVYTCTTGFEFDGTVAVDTVCIQEPCDAPASDTVEVAGNKTEDSCVYTCKSGFEYEGSVVADTVCAEKEKQTSEPVSFTFDTSDLDTEDLKQKVLELTGASDATLQVTEVEEGTLVTVVLTEAEDPGEGGLSLEDSLSELTVEKLANAYAADPSAGAMEIKQVMVQPTPEPTAKAEPQTEGLPPGAIVGIAAGSLTLVGAGAFLLWKFVLSKPGVPLDGGATNADKLELGNQKGGETAGSPTTSPKAVMITPRNE